jgi:hypothetical protein
MPTGRAVMRAKRSSSVTRVSLSLDQPAVAKAKNTPTAPSTRRKPPKKRTVAKVAHLEEAILSKLEAAALLDEAELLEDAWSAARQNPKPTGASTTRGALREDASPRAQSARGVLLRSPDVRREIETTALSFPSYGSLPSRRRVFADDEAPTGTAPSGTTQSTPRAETTAEEANLHSEQNGTTTPRAALDTHRMPTPMPTPVPTPTLLSTHPPFASGSTPRRTGWASPA